MMHPQTAGECLFWVAAQVHENNTLCEYPTYQDSGRFIFITVKCLTFQFKKIAHLACLHLSGSLRASGLILASAILRAFLARAAL